MTRVFYASTLFSALTLSAALDAGLFGERDERRLLIVSDNTAAPELGHRLDETPGFAPLRDRFDDVVSWNELITPLHPSDWVPRAGDVPVLSRLIMQRLDLHDVRELAVESIAVAPARTLALLIRDCPVTAYADGLMSYGPTRDELPVDVGQRVGRLLHLDLVPGLRPLLLREYGVEPVAIPSAAFAKVLAELPQPHELPDTPGQAAGPPMVLGQYLSALGIVTPGEEIELYAGMLRALAAGGHRHVVFKPHPAAGRAHTRPLRDVAHDLGLTLTVAEDGLPAEVWFAAVPPSLVVSCFSTALFTARHLFAIPVATAGTELALDRLTPYQNSNRIPATVVDALVPHLLPDGRVVAGPDRDVDALVAAVGYCMQARRHADLRRAAQDYVRGQGHQRYFKRQRVTALGLVSARPSGRVRLAPAARAARRLGRRVRAVLRVARHGDGAFTQTSPPRRERAT